METEHFSEWFEKIFVKHTKQLSGEKLLIYDGHVSHMSLDVINQEKNNNIHIICLPPHSTHLLQPLDVGVFKHVKTRWRQIVAEHNCENSFALIQKEIFRCSIRITAITLRWLSQIALFAWKYTEEINT